LAKKSFLSEATVMVSYFHPKPRTTGTLSGASVPAGRSRGPWEPGVATGPDVGSAGATQMHVKVAGCGSRCRCLEHGPLHHTEPHGTTLTLTVLYCSLPTSPSWEPSSTCTPQIFACFGNYGK